MMKTLVLLACVVGAFSGYGYRGAEMETIEGHLDFTHSSKSLNEYYPGLQTAIELPVLRYTYDWLGEGLEDSLVIPLYGCTSNLCNCADGETALLVEVDSWNLRCQLLPFHATMAEQRSIGSETKTKEDGSSPLQQSNTELTGSTASSSSAGVFAGLKAQNKEIEPEEETEEAPTGRSLDPAPATQPPPFLPQQPIEATTTKAATTTTTKAATTEAATTTTTATTTKSTTTTTTSTEAPEVASTEEPKKPVVANVEQATEAKEPSQATATTEAVSSPVEEATEKESIMHDIQDESEPDIGESDDQFILQPEQKPATENKPEGGEVEEEDDKEGDGLFDADTKSDQEPDQINLYEGIKSYEADSWRAKYYTILGFFICFIIVFVIVVLFVIIKMKKNRAARAPTMIGATTGNVSPGPALERSFHGGDDENEPLTPAAGLDRGSQPTFKFDGPKTHTPLPR